MATQAVMTGGALDLVRQQKQAVRTVVRKELRNLSPEVKHQEGKHRYSCFQLSDFHHFALNFVASVISPDPSELNCSLFGCMRDS